MGEAGNGLARLVPPVLWQLSSQLPATPVVGGGVKPSRAAEQSEIGAHVAQRRGIGISQSVPLTSEGRRAPVRVGADVSVPDEAPRIGCSGPTPDRS